MRVELFQNYKKFIEKDGSLTYNQQISFTENPPKKVPHYKSYIRVMLIVINLSLSNFYFGYVLSYINTLKFD